MSRCGTITGYQEHRVSRTPACRPCKDAQAAWQRSYEKRRYLNRGPLLIDSAGTRRRLQALAVIGWPRNILSERLGTARSTLTALKHGRGRVHRDTAAKVAALYDELSMTQGPSRRTRTEALAKGWVPPLAWDDDKIDRPEARATKMVRHVSELDEIAVERAVRGIPTHLRPTERAEAVRRLTDLGLSAQEIARRLNVARRSVVRIRQAIARAA